MPRLIPLRAPKDLNFWRGGWKTSKRVRATKRLIQDEKNLIARSKQEAEDLTTQLKTELTELSNLSRQIVPGEDKDDETAIAEADRVSLEAIEAIDEFPQ
jgi:septal ring factor EnvC (AmiA/AmiB activator)